MEKRLVRKLKARDPRAFEQLVLRFQGQIFNYIYRMIGSQGEAEDLAQEVFVTVFKKIDGFRGDSALSTWIYKIATNHVKNRKKYLGRRPYDRPAPAENYDRQSNTTSAPGVGARMSRPDELVEGYQTERIIQTAIGELEEEQRAVLILRDIQNTPYEEISEITGLPLGTVKSRLHRARMHLKDRIDAQLRK